MNSTINIHGSAIALAIDADGPPVGIILLGASGVGKTSACFSLIDQCPYGRTRLIADDNVLVTKRDNSLWITHSPGFGGLAEMRHAGLIRLPFTSNVLLQFALNAQSGSRLGPASQFAPLGANGPSVPQLIVPGFASVRVLIRSLLAGHSLTGGFD